MTQYDLVVIAWSGCNRTDLAALYALAPSWRIVVVLFDYDPAWQKGAFEGGGGGGAYINWLLAHDMYFSLPQLAPYDYMMRFDDDIVVFETSTLDPFADMHASGIEVGWAQHIADNEFGLLHPIFRLAQEHAAAQDASGFQVSDVWRAVTNPSNTGPHNPYTVWRPYLTAGCVEMYATRVFRNPHYIQYLQAVRAEEYLRSSSIWEQEVKTLWQQLYVPARHWRSYACALPVYHKDMATRDAWFLSSGCNFKNHTVVDRGRCDLDPEMRFC